MSPHSIWRALKSYSEALLVDEYPEVCMSPLYSCLRPEHDLSDAKNIFKSNVMFDKSENWAETVADTRAISSVFALLLSP